MKVIFAAIAIVTLTGSTLSGQNPAALTKLEAMINAEAGNEVKQIEREVLTALVDGDLPKLEYIWAKEYTFTIPNGAVISKKQYLEMLKSHDLSYASLQPKHVKVEVYGNTAIASGQVAINGKVGSEIMNATDAYLTVYVFRNDRWQQVATLATRIQNNPKTP
jgi:hypothetical protein